MQARTETGFLRQQFVRHERFENQDAPFSFFNCFFSFYSPPRGATSEATNLPFKKRLKDRPKPLMHNCGNLVIFEHKRVLESRSEC